MVKVSKSLIRRLFVMHLQRELDFRQLRAEPLDMNKSVEVAQHRTLLTIKSLAGGGA